MRAHGHRPGRPGRGASRRASGLSRLSLRQLAHEVVASESDIRATLFGSHPYAFVLLAEEGMETVGFALYFFNYSTFLGRPGLYLEDLYVVPTFRGRGYGKALLARLAAIAVDRKCGRMEWNVLSWNEPAIRFYESLHI